MTAELFQGLRDPSLRHFGVGECLRRAQQDEILNENCQAPRGPRTGETNPASISARIALRGRCSSFSTSRTP
jgi:hypothetical protein